MTTEEEYLQGLIEYFERMEYWKSLGVTFDSLQVGRACVKLTVDDKVENANHSLHGGAIASLLDMAMSLTLRSTYRDPITTVSLTTNFISPAAFGKTVYASATIVSSKRRMQYVEAKIEDEDGLIIANGVGIFSLLKRKDEK